MRRVNRRNRPNKWSSGRQNVLCFKLRQDSGDFGTYSATNSFVAQNAFWQLGDLRTDEQAFIGNYLYYKITGLKYEFYPRLNVNTAFVSTTGVPASLGFGEFVYQICPKGRQLQNLGSEEATFNGFISHPATKVKPGNRKISVYLKPQIAMQATVKSDSTATPQYVWGPAKYMLIQNPVVGSLDTTQWGTLFYGYNQPTDSLFTSSFSAQSYQIVTTVYMMLKDRIVF